MSTSSGPFKVLPSRRYASWLSTVPERSLIRRKTFSLEIISLRKHTPTPQCGLLSSPLLLRIYSPFSIELVSVRSTFDGSLIAYRCTLSISNRLAIVCFQSIKILRDSKINNPWHIERFFFLRSLLECIFDSKQKHLLSEGADLIYIIYTNISLHGNSGSRGADKNARSGYATSNSTA